MERNIPQELQSIFEAHTAMKAANPTLSETQWDIRDIPYSELNNWRLTHNDKNQDRENHLLTWKTLEQRKVYLGVHSWMIPEMPDGVYIRMHSKEVKRVSVVEVIEE